MKKLSIYYGCHIVVNIALLIFFNAYIELHLLSVLPVFLIVLMFFQATLFKENAKNDTIGDTAYSVGNTVRLTEEEQAIQYSYLRHSFLFCVPFEIPLIFFLSSYWKLFGIIPYILAYIIGSIVFKLKKGQEIQNRIIKEKKELEEQIKREEMGLK
ncbi:MAG: hypothetical protein E7662_08985 [Ruminococcaceae bacterium]|nr:hypothetical protein [Oscillospiraceae bacterium]